MKINVKYSALLLALVLLLPLLGACGGGKKIEVNFDDLVAAADAAIGNEDSMISIGESYVKGSMKMDASDYEEFVVKVNAFGINIDEYGIFKAADQNQAKQLEESIKEYLKFRDDSWMTEYLPGEYPKLQGAEYRTEGLYVMYAILSEEGKTSVFNAFKSCFE